MRQHGTHAVWRRPADDDGRITAAAAPPRNAQPSARLPFRQGRRIGLHGHRKTVAAQRLYSLFKNDACFYHLHRASTSVLNKRGL
ncbi:MAG: hypothetical protein AW07_01294 [Candidatus Accumulibacter sp. SK-11]|nr:MAG: hypothetical protein AW07_01294 [Candidatus Accumulibacter sp. SK-11]